MSKGFLIVAKNHNDTDYVQCARVLAKSLRLTNPHIPVALLTDSTDYTGLDCFDHVITFPHGDAGSGRKHYQNDWQAFDASPFSETIKIEADVIVTTNLDHWWTACANRELVIATGCRTYFGEIASSRRYRHLFDENCLPDVYNGITYFRKTRFARQFFSLVKTCFLEWDNVKTALVGSVDLDGGSTDMVYAVAARIIGTDRCTLPTNQLQWVHMKPAINGTRLDKWDDELVWELIGGDFRINTISQLYPVHYGIKELAATLEPIYDHAIATRV